MPGEVAGCRVRHPALLKMALSIGSALNVSRDGPELGFLRYRPVLLNTALKQDFGYVPRKTSGDAFAAFVAARAARAAQGRPVAAVPASGAQR